MQNAHLSLLAAARPGVAPDITVLLGTEPELHAAVDELVAGLPGTTRLVRVGNPLRSPLTVERILIQAGKEEIGLLPDEAADAALQRLCQRQDGESQVILLVEQAETLDLGTLRALSRLAMPNGRPEGTGTAPLRIVLAGQPPLRHLLNEPIAAMFRTALDPAGTPAGGTRSLFSAMLREVPKVPAAVQPAPVQPSVAAADDLDEAPLVQPVAPHVVLAPMVPEPDRLQPRMPGLLRGVLALVMLSVLGAGAVLGLPYVLQWLGQA